MKNLKKHGYPPYGIAVIHGGPGAAGEMAPVAQNLAAFKGILEPWQTETSIDGQVRELKVILEKNGSLPIVLIGFSWGAWLGFIFAALNPTLVKKLILVGSGPFEEAYASYTSQIRMNRLGDEERLEIQSTIDELAKPDLKDREKILAKLERLLAKSDAYDPIPGVPEKINFQPEIYRQVWPQASELRKSGRLLSLGRLIKCPVVAIHGDYDPHPAEGVEKPLSLVLKDFRFILLGKCGHKPWIERQARDEFFRILKNELLKI